MEMLEANKLILFIAFVIPGFISLKTYELLFPAVPKETSKQVIDAVAYSSVNYALLLWPIYEIESHSIRASHPTAYVLFCIFVLFVAPISWACAFTKLRKSKFLQLSVPHPTGRPWDFVFSQRKPYWVVVTLKDGKKYGGRYDEKSFASSSPSPDQLYLEEAWHVTEEGGLGKAKETSAGILILSADISTIELFAIEYPDLPEVKTHDGHEKADCRGLPASALKEGLPADQHLSESSRRLPTGNESG